MSVQPLLRTSAKSKSRPPMRPRLRRRGGWGPLLEMVVWLIAVYALAELAAPRFLVEGPSMQPTFYSEQRLIVSRVNYLLAQPQRGDIVVFNPPQAAETDAPLIKRLLGLPGDQVAFRDARLLINDQFVDEPYLSEPCSPDRCPDNLWVLGEDDYFVLGDNRNHSRDSRSFGLLNLEHIIGEAVVRYWPPRDWGLVDHLNVPQPFLSATPFD